MMRGSERNGLMAHPMHENVVDLVNRAIELMDEFLRSRIDQQEYLAALQQLDVNDILAAYQDDFKTNASLVYYLDALMMLSSLQHELDFQVSEYGASVASEDIKMLKEVLKKFPGPKNDHS